MVYIVLGKTSEGEVFVDRGTSVEAEARNLLDCLRSAQWNVNLYGKPGEFTAEDKSMIRSLLMAQTTWARNSLKKFGIKPIA